VDSVLIIGLSVFVKSGPDHIGSPDDSVTRAEALGPISPWMNRYDHPAHRCRVITAKYTCIYI